MKSAGLAFLISKSNQKSNHKGKQKVIELCSILADSHHSNAFLIDGFGLDYSNTLVQTERVVEYLSSHDNKQEVQRYEIVEGEYISQYLQELERSNRIRLGPDTIENHDFNLYDIDQDGVPELILYESTTGAGTHYHFYTMKDGEAVECGEYGRTALYADGGEGLIAYYYRMSNYEAKDLILRGDTMYVGDIAEGELDPENGFPELEDLGYVGFERLLFCPPAIPMAMYTYNLDLENRVNE